MNPHQMLVVEDYNPLRVLLHKALDRRNIRVQEAANGLEGLRILESEPVDLVMLDLKMPVMDGLELLEHMRSRNMDTPVIISSGFLCTGEVPRAVRLGVVDFLIKPFEMSRMGAVVDDVLLRAREYGDGLAPERLDRNGKLRRARWWVQLRRFDAALALLEKMLEEHPDDAEALMLEALVSEVCGDFRTAEKAYKQTCLTLHPEDAGDRAWLVTA